MLHEISATKAEVLWRLHHGPPILVLPNAWDCASARLFEEAGFPAIATTSAGVAFTLGYSDGQFISREEMLAVVRRIAACVEVPVTADLESGYGDAALTAQGLLESGAVGLNLEDTVRDTVGLVDVEEQCARIRAVRRVGDSAGVHLVINARCDAYLFNIGDPRTRFEQTCERLKRYIDAGADCLFLPGLGDAEVIAQFAQALRFPLNILVGPGVPPTPRLQELGVARVSVGSAAMRATMGLTRDIARELRSTGDYGTMLRTTVPFVEACRLFMKTAG